MRIVYGFFFLLLSILIYQLVVVQIVRGDFYSERANNQYISRGDDVFDRGAIFFTEKSGEKVSAATVRSGFIIAINPSAISDAEAVYAALSSIVDINEDDFSAKAAKKDDQYEEIVNHLDVDTADRVRALGIDGVMLSKDNWRYYPGDDLAAHALGFVGYRGHELTGQYGLERYYNDVLSRSAVSFYVNVFAEIFSNIQLFDRNDKQKGDLITSIEPSVQNVLENQLNGVMERWSADSAGGVVMDPKTGIVYGLANMPDFDPNSYNMVSDPSVFPNPIIENVYEMGSILKPLTIAAGIDSGAITARTEYHDDGYIIVDGARISNYDGVGRGVVDMQHVLSESLNTGAVFTMNAMGKDVFRKYMFAYGLGDETGVDLPHEAAGLVNNLNSTRMIEYATASFGQGIAVTPIEMVRALAVLANGGVLATPHLIIGVNYEDGTSKNITPMDGEQVLKKETVDEVTKMLITVVDDALLGGAVKLDDYSIAAKTGTAQIARGDGRGYYDDRYLHSFFGYFPAYDPRFIVFLYVVYPKGALYSSHTLTYPFMDIAKFLLNYYNIPPDR
ncbi:hypothetical protein AUJ44_02910 [Candidatus Nomurabacteria bacterium CG1_02_47_685]|nr:MAG: hypothetical protein AUJ44_02910 [Candidatus Nomurabacteria bacterium CG1_02_47_685]